MSVAKLCGDCVVLVLCGYCCGKLNYWVEHLNARAFIYLLKVVSPWLNEWLIQHACSK